MTSIIPPHILEVIAKNGTPAQRKLAEQSLKESEKLREIRISEMERAIPLQAPFTSPHKNRLIYDAKNTTNLPGSLVRNEGQSPTNDIEVNEVYDGLGATFDLYWEVFKRNSIDDKGMDLIGSVHVGNEWDNAMWNGTQMLFGDGDQTIFNRFTIAIDIMGHEVNYNRLKAVAWNEAT